MPKRRRRQPGNYKPKPEPQPNFTGPKPLTLFQGPDGLWGAKDGEGNVEIEPRYQLEPQTEEQKKANVAILVKPGEVLSVTPDDWDVIAWCCLD